jgi:hypothetical protein
MHLFKRKPKGSPGGAAGEFDNDPNAGGGDLPALSAHDMTGKAYSIDRRTGVATVRTKGLDGGRFVPVAHLPEGTTYDADGGDVRAPSDREGAHAESGMSVGRITDVRHERYVRQGEPGAGLRDNRPDEARERRDAPGSDVRERKERGRNPDA